MCISLRFLIALETIIFLIIEYIYFIKKYRLDARNAVVFLNILYLLLLNLFYFYFYDGESVFDTGKKPIKIATLD